MSQNEIEQIEVSIEEAKQVVAMGELARKMADNPTFKTLVLEGYFRDEAARLALLVSDPQMAPHRELIMRDLDSIGGFKRYLSTKIQMGDIARREIAEGETELDDLRQEDGAE